MNFLDSWKTTIIGLAAIGVGIFMYTKGTMPEVATLAVITGFGMLLGKDFNTSGTVKK